MDRLVLIIDCLIFWVEHLQLGCAINRLCRVLLVLGAIYGLEILLGHRTIVLLQRCWWSVANIDRCLQQISSNFRLDMNFFDRLNFLEIAIAAFIMLMGSFLALDIWYAWLDNPLLQLNLLDHLRRLLVERLLCVLSHRIFVADGADWIRDLFADRRWVRSGPHV